MNYLVCQANNILKDQAFEYAFCGGYAIDLFLDYESRKHGDIDITAFWSDRDKIIKYMQSLDYEVYEMLGGGKGFHITDVRTQYKVKNNIFCWKKDYELIVKRMSEEQRNWLDQALMIMNPNGHKWSHIKKTIESRI